MIISIFVAMCVDSINYGSYDVWVYEQGKGVTT